MQAEDCQVPKQDIHKQRKRCWHSYGLAKSSPLHLWRPNRTGNRPQATRGDLWPNSKPCACLERWVLKIQPYMFKVKYQPGPKNITDPLSRLVNSMENGSKRSSQAEKYVQFVAVSATPSAMTTREVEGASATDEELSAVRQCISGKPWDQLVYKRYLPCSGKLGSIGKLILRGTRIVIPK